ncbi:hypothetical protein B0H10DRAFT_1964147 [Mycena sp. CBHHK59/15]|nr:hypothetical protein B0H10DRAFT_1964147 [Mycena sp. CBHHK59/15]
MAPPPSGSWLFAFHLCPHLPFCLPSETILTMAPPTITSIYKKSGSGTRRVPLQIKQQIKVSDRSPFECSRIVAENNGMFAEGQAWNQSGREVGGGVVELRVNTDL